MRQAASLTDRDRRLRPVPIAVGALARAAALAFALTAAAPAWPADWNADAVARYGGTYAVDCANPAALHVRISADALVIEKAGRTMTGRQLEVSFSYFGQQPPPQYQVAVLSRLRTRVELTAVVYRDGRGRYVQLQPDPKLMAALGLTPNDATRYRDCAADRRQTDGAAAAGEERQRAPAQPQAVLASPLADREFKRAYYRALGPRVNETWLAQLDGPSPGQKSVQIAGFGYVELAFCKAHDCHDHSLVLLYSRDQGKVFGLVFDGNRSALIGDPPAPVATELERLWRSEWRQSR